LNKKKNPGRFVTLELCDERVKRLEGKIDDLKEATQQQHKDIKKDMKTIAGLPPWEKELARK